MKFTRRAIRSDKSRRKFLKASGAIIAGLGLTRTLYSILRKDLNASAISATANDLSVRTLQEDGILPDEVKALWDLSKAFRQSNPKRESICINGLWQWKPS